jgi:hypothetical protein
VLRGRTFREEEMFHGAVALSVFFGGKGFSRKRSPQRTRRKPRTQRKRKYLRKILDGRPFY